MTLSMRRIAPFTKDMPEMVRFYRDVLGLKLKKDEKGWKEFGANGCGIALLTPTGILFRFPTGSDHAAKVAEVRACALAMRP